MDGREDMDEDEKFVPSYPGEGSKLGILPNGVEWRIRKDENGRPTIYSAKKSTSKSTRKEWPLGNPSKVDDTYSRFYGNAIAGLKKPTRERGSVWQSVDEMREHNEAMERYNQDKMAAVRAAKREKLGGDLFINFVDASGQIQRMRNPDIDKQALLGMPARWYAQKTIKLLFPRKKVTPAASMIIHALGPDSSLIFKQWWEGSFGNQDTVKKEHVLLFVRELEDGEINDERSKAMKTLLDGVRSRA